MILEVANLGREEHFSPFEDFPTAAYNKLCRISPG